MYETAEAVRAMRDAIDTYLRGAMSAAELADRALDAKRSVAANPIAAHHATNLAELGCRGGELRREDVVEYARELAEGLSLVVSRAGSVRATATALAARAGVSVVRRMSNGLGVVDSVRIASAATGQSFTAWSTRPSSLSDWSEVSVPTGDVAFGVVDLVESFLWDVIEEPGATFEIDLELLPEVALLREDDNGNRVEIRTFRSYTGAMREARRFEALGHKQRYWVEVKREPRW
jgi:hypothetical protein